LSASSATVPSSRVQQSALIPAASPFAAIKDSLRTLYLEDPRPWLIGFSGGKDSTLVAALIFEVVAAIPKALRIKEISVA